MIKVINKHGRVKEYGKPADLWHIAMKLDGDGLNGASADILEVWHMAHDLKDAILGTDKARIITDESQAPATSPDNGNAVERIEEKALRVDPSTSRWLLESLRANGDMVDMLNDAEVLVRVLQQRLDDLTTGAQSESSNTKELSA